MTTPVPRISVGMPVFNAGSHLAPAIEAVLAQSCTDFELIISDNASTDGSYAICERFAAQDPRVRLVRHDRNVGSPRNYNTVARLARAPYFKWASANDLIHPRFLSECAKVLDEHPECILCYPRTRLFAETPEDGTDYEDGLDLRADSAFDRYLAVHEKLRLNNVMNGVVRRDALLRVGLMPEFLAGDTYMVAELSLLGTFIELPAVMFYRRMTPDSATKLKGGAAALRHFFPTRTPRILFQNWRQCVASTRAVLRHPLPPAQRMRALALTMRMWLWRRRSLLGDLLQAVRFVSRRTDHEVKRC